MKIELQPIIDRVHDGHCLHRRVARGGQLPVGRADQLDGQQLEDGLCQLFTNAAPHPTAEGDVMEAAHGLCAGGVEAVWVKATGGALVDSGCLMRVTDAVHDAPAFGDLVALGMGREEEHYIPEQPSVLVEGEQRVPGDSPTTTAHLLCSNFSPQPSWDPWRLLGSTLP